MRNEFYKATLDFTEGSAYNYRLGSEIPTKIEYRRAHDGKFETEIVEAPMCLLKLHNVMYLIKRGYTRSEIDNEVNLNYKEYEMVYK